MTVAPVTLQPIVALEPGDFVSYARPTDPRPFLRRVTSVNRRNRRREDGTDDVLVTVTIACHPREHRGAAVRADVISGWASEATTPVLTGQLEEA